MNLPVTEYFRRISLPVRCGLLLLVLVAAGLRWDVYPKTYFADELIPRAVVVHMQASHSLDTNWANADWHGDYAGSFYKLTQYNFSSYHTLLLLCREAANLAGMGNIADLVVYRAVSLVCQLLCLLLVFFIARRLAGESAGLLAVAFFAVLPQAVVDAHYARPESFVMLLVALASWLSLEACSRRNWRYTVAEAVVWGVAFACKFSFFPVVLLACAAQLSRFRSAVFMLAWCAGFVAGIALSAPYILLDMQGFMHGVGLLLGQYAPQVAGMTGFARLLPSAHQLIPYLLDFFGAPVLLLIGVSFLQQGKQLRCFAFFSLGISVFYILLFARQGVFFERNLSHLLPLWAVMFALGFQLVFHFIRQHWYFWLVLVLFLSWPLYLSIQIDRYFFNGMETVQQDVSRYEQGLQAEFSVTRIIPFQLMGDMQKDIIGPQDVLRVPQHKLPEMVQVDTALVAAGFQRIAYIELPLSFLPYNQLQINHFPPAYSYYRREVVAGSGVRP